MLLSAGLRMGNCHLMCRLLAGLGLDLERTSAVRTFRVFSIPLCFRESSGLMQSPCASRISFDHGRLLASRVFSSGQCSLEDKSRDMRVSYHSRNHSAASGAQKAPPAGLSKTCFGSGMLCIVHYISMLMVYGIPRRPDRNPHDEYACNIHGPTAAC